jgi:hypothetical protein
MECKEIQKSAVRVEDLYSVQIATMISKSGHVIQIILRERKVPYVV